MASVAVLDSSCDRSSWWLEPHLGNTLNSMASDINIVDCSFVREDPLSMIANETFRIIPVFHLVTDVAFHLQCGKVGVTTV